MDIPKVNPGASSQQNAAFGGLFAPISTDRECVG